jgi:hypothetical protein
MMPLPCLTACLQAKHLLENEDKVLTKPHENPAITQAQLDKKRRAIEAHYKPRKGVVNYKKYRHQYKAANAPTPSAGATGNGGAGRGPIQFTPFCPDDPDKRIPIPSDVVVATAGNKAAKAIFYIGQFWANWIQILPLAQHQPPPPPQIYGQCIPIITNPGPQQPAGP